jgi:hypothetical protein
LHAPMIILSAALYPYSTALPLISELVCSIGQMI